ncbi:MAG TPA: thioredoxin domain-containing protein [Candidatus Polarisedimenticolia bacterium]|nr:thioredoxin domain-containing protein [Candidatus Polarisedimenticolia bacterium]
MTEPRRQNRLAGETSPYLLQHAHNPVDWYPWGREALDRARREDRPILLSIGYSACHWCHVMERESFEDEETARVMNEHFVCIKVDREERPDVDMIYMNAVQIMTGSGGWPLNVFLAPDLKPFYGGTYFPPAERHGLPAFRAVLDRVAQTYREKRGRVASSGDQIAGYIAQMSKVTPSREMLTDDLLRAALQELKTSFDPRDGGWGQAPKFPHAAGISLLLRIHRRLHDPEALAMATLTLEKMARGGMYDQLGGGFHRYSTDARWLVPHFEKMLYDNALLVVAYLEAFQATGKALFARIARECLDYVGREMTSKEGGFFSAQDADSEGVEGKFFVWTPEEIGAAAGEEAARAFCAYYDVRPGGNWEGLSILHVPREAAEVAQELGLGLGTLESLLSEARSRLLKQREGRVRPGLDDKILTSWNGLMISAFARGFQVIEEPAHLEVARGAARFLLKSLRAKEGGLLRTSRGGVAKLDGCLDDYAFVTAGLIDLYETDFDPQWVLEARGLVDRMLDRFWNDADGAFFFTAKNQEDLIIRSQTGYDGALPSGNSVAALALYRLARLTGEGGYAEKATGILRAYRDSVVALPAGFSQMLCALDFYLDNPKEVALVGLRSAPDTSALLRAIRKPFAPNKVVAFSEEKGSGVEEAARVVPLLSGKTTAAGKSAAYVCENFRCKAPTSDPKALEAALAGV